MNRVVAGIKTLLKLNHPGRNLAVFPDDVFIVSYPKSGNTWTRFLIGNLVHPEPPADFSNINTIIPDPEALSRRRLARLPRPRIIKSHQHFDPRYRKVIYVVRDPRDVVISQYYFHRKRKLIADNSPLETFVTRFVSGATSPYGSWGENVASWLATRFSDPAFILLRYEHMLQDPVRELNRIAGFLGIDCTPEFLGKAVERSSSQQMRELEKQQGHLWSSTKNTRGDIPFVRTAKAGAWKTELSSSAISRIEEAWGPLITWLGYGLASSTEATRENGVPRDFTELISSKVGRF